MNKLNRTTRQRNYFNSIDRIKRELNASPRKRADKKPYSQREESERLAREAAQKLYNEQQEAIMVARAKAEAAELRKELDDLFASE